MSLRAKTVGQLQALILYNDHDTRIPATAESSGVWQISQNTSSYQRLANDNNTRFIELHPATHFGDPIRVTIVDRTYDIPQTHHAISYEALSYAWGSDMVSEYISVGANSRLRVRRNVANILRYLRHGLDPVCAVRTLWIDAVCINQADNDEKGKQVAMMGKIYACAARVLIWTGEPGRDLQALRDDFTGGALAVYSDNRAPQVIWLTQFFRSGWFTRRWVIQEIMHAREAYIICGKNTMDWQRFRSFVKVLERGLRLKALTPRVVAILDHLNHLTAMRQAESEEPASCDMGTTIAGVDDSMPSAESMTTLLTRYSATKCADGRDRVYALRSLSSTSIPVNYQISTAELYELLGRIEVVRYPMAIMSCAGAFGVSAASWIPDWRGPMRYNPFHSSLKMQCPTPPVEEGLVGVTNATLTIQASFSGVVDSVLDQQGFRYETEDMALHRWSTYFARRHKTKMSELSAESVEVLFCALSATSIEPEGNANSQPSSCLRQMRFWRHRVNGDPNQPIGLQKAGLLHTARKMNLAHTKRGRSCFFTNAGQFGLGPDSIQAGDWVVNMPGCDSMMALRPIDDEQNTAIPSDMESSRLQALKVVGDCWMPGLVKSNRKNTASNLRTFHIV